MSPEAALDGLYGLGHWLLERERISDALHVFRTLLTTAPSDERGWLGLGTCHERLGQHRTACDLYTLGSATLTTSFRCALAEARMHRRSGADDKADVAYETAEERADTGDIATAIAAERLATS